MTNTKVLILLVTVAFAACVSQAIDTKTVTEINTDMLTLAMNSQTHQRQNRDANAKIDSGNSKKSFHRFDMMGHYKTGHHEKYRYVHDGKGKYNHDTRGFYAPSKIENLISKSGGRTPAINISDAARSFSSAPAKIRVTLSLLRPISVDEDISFMSRRPERKMKRFNYKRFQTPIVVSDDDEKIEETTTEMMMPSTMEPQVMETTQNMMYMESGTTMQHLTTTNAIKSHLIATIKQDMMTTIKSAEMEEHMMKPSTMPPHTMETHKNEDHMMNSKEPHMMTEMPMKDSHMMDSHIAMSSNDNSQIKKPKMMEMHKKDDMMEPDMMESRVSESHVKDSQTKEAPVMETHMTETQKE